MIYLYNVGKNEDTMRKYSNKHFRYFGIFIRRAGNNKEINDAI